MVPLMTICAREGMGSVMLCDFAVEREISSNKITSSRERGVYSFLPRLRGLDSNRLTSFSKRGFFLRILGVLRVVGSRAYLIPFSLARRTIRSAGYSERWDWD